MPKKDFHPSQEILEKYANVLVNFALGGGKGIKKGETVIVKCNEYGKRLYVELAKAIWKSGGHMIGRYSPDNDLDKEFFQLAEQHQLDFFPHHYFKGLVEQADHTILILCETDKKALEGIHPQKIMSRNISNKPYMDWRNEKENAGKFTWTIGLYGTPAMAKEAKLSQKAYWDQIISACFLDKRNPIAEWKKVYEKIELTRQRLNSLPIDKLHVLGKDVDLWITLGDKRIWNGGGGRNIPSFEIFTSPDWRGTNGWIKFNQPLYYAGTLIEGVELHFKDGVVVKSKATKNEKVLKHMIAAKNADKIGEFSLTDRRFSNITKFMAETLFDENIGGTEGNTHIALGMSYHDCYDGNPSKPTTKEWQDLGFNDSSVHTDIISTTNRTVTAHFKDDSHIIIYSHGEFKI